MVCVTPTPDIRGAHVKVNAGTGMDDTQDERRGTPRLTARGDTDVYYRIQKSTPSARPRGRHGRGAPPRATKPGCGSQKHR